jgi:hypothetical protein
MWRVRRHLVPSLTPRRQFFWSVIAVDNVRFRVLPDPLKRFLINNQRLAHPVLRRSEACRCARRQLAADAERAEVSPHVPVLLADGRRGRRLARGARG